MSMYRMRSLDVQAWQVKEIIKMRQTGGDFPEAINVLLVSGQMNFIIRPVQPGDVVLQYQNKFLSSDAYIIVFPDGSSRFIGRDEFESRYEPITNPDEYTSTYNGDDVGMANPDLVDEAEQGYDPEQITPMARITDPEVIVITRAWNTLSEDFDQFEISNAARARVLKYLIDRFRLNAYMT